MIVPRALLTAFAALPLLLAAVPTRPNEPPPSPPACPPPAAPTSANETRAFRIVRADAEDAGVVKMWTLVRRAVAFQNTLDTPVSVTIDGRSCGCLQVILSKSDVPPGEQTELTFGVSAVPAVGVQMQIVTLRATWTDAKGPQVERINVPLQYQTEVSFFVRPESACLTGIQGGRAHLDVFMYEPGAPGDPPTVGPPTCSLPGWTVRTVDDPVEVPRPVLHFRAEGPVAAEPGCIDGIITWAPSDADPNLNGTAYAARVPLRILTRSAYRAFPGGLVFARGPGDTTATLGLTLVARSDAAPPPASVRLDSETPWLSVRLDPPARAVTCTLTPAPDMPPTGSVRCRALAADGAALLDFPIVWHTSATGGPSIGDPVPVH
ncbi:MAG: DUF1573 domain-containing protein [Phycisphaerae bacterium]|nr:DUF1573 domain-containing protein [Phycisphaerae bacterium]